MRRLWLMHFLTQRLWCYMAEAGCAKIGAKSILTADDSSINGFLSERHCS